MKIYLATKYLAKERLLAPRDQITKLGHNVVSRWLDEAADADTHHEMYQAAIRDLEDIRKADLLILDTFDEDYRAGREVEFGMALGLNREVWLVGPRRNIFHHLVPHFDSWPDVLDCLREDV